MCFIVRRKLKVPVPKGTLLGVFLVELMAPWTQAQMSQTYRPYYIQAQPYIMVSQQVQSQPFERKSLSESNPGTVPLLVVEIDI